MEKKHLIIILLVICAAVFGLAVTAEAASAAREAGLSSSSVMIAMGGSQTISLSKGTGTWEIQDPEIAALKNVQGKSVKIVPKSKGSTVLTCMTGTRQLQCNVQVLTDAVGEPPEMGDYVLVKGVTMGLPFFAEDDEDDDWDDEDDEDWDDEDWDDEDWDDEDWDDDDWDDADWEGASGTDRIRMQVPRDEWFQRYQDGSPAAEGVQDRRSGAGTLQVLGRTEALQVLGGAEGLQVLGGDDETDARSDELVDITCDPNLAKLSWEFGKDKSEVYVYVKPKAVGILPITFHMSSGETQTMEFPVVPGFRGKAKMKNNAKNYKKWRREFLAAAVHENSTTWDIINSVGYVISNGNYKVKKTPNGQNLWYYNCGTCISGAKMMNDFMKDIGVTSKVHFAGNDGGDVDIYDYMVIYMSQHRNTRIKLDGHKYTLNPQPGAPWPIGIILRN